MRSDYSRVFFHEGRAQPGNAPQYEGLWRAAGASWEFGDSSLIYIPDPDQYGKFKVASKVPGEQGNPEVTIQARYDFNMSDLLRVARKGCDHDFQIHMGQCESPRSFNEGWEKILIIESGRISAWSTDDLGALDPGQRAGVNEEVTVSGEDMYEVKKMQYAEKAAAQTTEEILDITICGADDCGLCGPAEDKCDKIFALKAYAYGNKATVIYSKDAGATWGTSVITVATINTDADALACVGENLVVVSEAEECLFYAAIDDILNGVASWSKVTTGFAAAKGPLAIYSASPTYTWIVGEGGYIYFTDDPTSGVAVQDAGSATTQDLVDVEGMDELNVIAVGNSNAVVYTSNGGETWTSVTGPTPAVNLSAVWMKDKYNWLVGTTTGLLYYTEDNGTTWNLKNFPGSGSGFVREIKFATDSVGFMTHTTPALVGRILRSLDGGYSWYVTPEGTGTIPSNERLNAIAVCGNANVVYAGGLKNGVDGIIISGG